MSRNAGATSRLPVSFAIHAATSKMATALLNTEVSTGTYPEEYAETAAWSLAVLSSHAIRRRSPGDSASVRVAGGRSDEPLCSTGTQHQHQKPVSITCTASSQHQHQHRHPAPSTSNLSPPRAQPAHSTRASAGTQREQPVSKARAGNSLLFEVRTP